MSLTMLLRLAFISMFLISQLLLPGVGVGLAQHASGTMVCNISCTMLKHGDHTVLAPITTFSSSPNAHEPRSCCRLMSASCDMNPLQHRAPVSTPTPSAHPTCCCSMAPVDLPTPEPIVPALPTSTEHTLSMLPPCHDRLASSIMAECPCPHSDVASALHTLGMRSHNAAQASLGLWLT